MLLIALAFIGLAAFIGLTVDAGILFIQIGHLRRAVDSASLAAANQFREGRTLAEIEAAADEFINLNSLNPANAVIFICDIADKTATNPNPYHDVDLCPPDLNGDGTHDDSPPRKFVRVEATMPVEFAFLPIVGWGSIDIRAEAISETASVDLVLVIDTSQSMAWDAVCGDGIDDDAYWEGLLGNPPDGDDCDIGGTDGPQAGAYPDDYGSDPAICNDVDVAPGIQGQCKPFEDVRDAALSLVNRMYFPYDRMAVVSFDVNAVHQLQLIDPNSDKPSHIISAIGNLLVYKLPSCPGWDASKDPTGCTNTNIADGLLVGGNEFGLSLRQEAVPILILLSDGAANAATDNAGNFICPNTTGVSGKPTWVEPFCRDEDFEIGPGAYGAPDAEDMAVNRGYFVGCPDANAYDPLLTSCTAAGQGAVVFTIGLGDELINTDPCSSTPIGQSCGNYYYSPTGSGLIQVFEAIASRIFTRIVH
jgi:hypothetical protein